MSDALLAVSDLDARYGQSHVLQGVALEVREGSVVCLLGRNGAGKTTTLKSIMGIVPAARGRVCFDGRDVTHWPTHLIARAGIAYVPEDRGIFPSLSVQENLSLARPCRRAPSRWTLSRVFDLFPGLRERAAGSGAHLSGGEQQMLAIARALLTNPRLLILDEPSEGLAPVVIREIAAALDQLRAAGLSILLVEQNYPLAMRLSERVYLLGKGRVRFSGTPEVFERDAAMKHTWLGI